MNIFFLHCDPEKAARYQCDKHVVKMLLESVQLLYTCHAVLSSSIAEAPLAKGTGKPGYRPVHKNHPCSIWVRKTQLNYRWLCQLAASLAEEYHYRYPNKKDHACEEHVKWLTANIPAALLAPDIPYKLTKVALAMPDEYKRKNPIQAYREFYKGSKGERGLLTYTRRPSPHWLISETTRGTVTQK